MKKLHTKFVLALFLALPVTASIPQTATAGESFAELLQAAVSDNTKATAELCVVVDESKVLQVQFSHQLDRNESKLSLLRSEISLATSESEALKTEVLASTQEIQANTAALQQNSSELESLQNQASCVANSLCGLAKRIMDKAARQFWHGAIAGALITGGGGGTTTVTRTPFVSAPF